MSGYISGRIQNLITGRILDIRKAGYPIQLYYHSSSCYLTALADIGEEGGGEAGQVVAELVSRAECQPAHHRHQAQLHVQARTLPYDNHTITG